MTALCYVVNYERSAKDKYLTFDTSAPRGTASHRWCRSKVQYIASSRSWNFCLLALSEARYKKGSETLKKTSFPTFSPSHVVMTMCFFLQRHLLILKVTHSLMCVDVGTGYCVAAGHETKLWRAARGGGKSSTPQSFRAPLVSETSQLV